MKEYDTGCYISIRCGSLSRLRASLGRLGPEGWFDGCALRAAIREIDQGLIDADLGGGVIKQRIARPGGGKSGGFRTIILFRALLSYADEAIATAVSAGVLIEVTEDA